MSEVATAVVEDGIPGIPAEPAAVVPPQPEPSPSERAAQLAEKIAGPAADSVDREGRFPSEAIDALRSERLLSAMLPVDLGGEDASLTEMAAATQVLGQHCASTAMIFAMHQIQIASLLRHGRTAALRELLARVGREQLLIASATTEVGIGGDVRTSSCAVEQANGSFTLVKQAPVISYGAYADAILTTARRSPDSTPGDQVLVACLKENTALEPTGEWNTLGFRGTCSPGFLLRATGPVDLILDDSYSDISSRTMLPFSHSIWASVWLGIADAAVGKARQYVQAAARAKPGTTPPSAIRLSELAVRHQQFVDVAVSARNRYEQALNDPDYEASMAYAIAMNTVKLSASAMVVDIVGQALSITGISGYREDGGYRMGRLLRDAYGASLMVSNERILTNNAQLLLVHRG